MKILKKNIVLFLLLIASIPTLLAILFDANRIYIREKMKTKLEKEFLITIHIPFKDVQWVKKNKEILFEGRLFDIKSIRSNGDLYIMTGLFDDDETALVNNFERIQKRRSSSEDINSFYTQLIQLFQSVYFDFLDPSSLAAYHKKLYCHTASNPLPKIYRAVLTPPPQGI